MRKTMAAVCCIAVLAMLSGATSATAATPPSPQPKAESSWCVACAIWLTRGAIAIGSRLAARRGAKQLAKTKLRRFPARGPGSATPPGVSRREQGATLEGSHSATAQECDAR